VLTEIQEMPDQLASTDEMELKEPLELQESEEV